ncbi:hypothetical protein H9P43_003198 [Blastocladiella emersonii ATCC 22665]|nr:hypothetical protein H9P43_003198 [Blastocladiella emersonii ATCC 22665]
MATAAVDVPPTLPSGHMEVGGEPAIDVLLAPTPVEVAPPPLPPRVEPEPVVATAAVDNEAAVSRTASPDIVVSAPPSNDEAERELLVLHDFPGIWDSADGTAATATTGTDRDLALSAPQLMPALPKGTRGRILGVAMVIVFMLSFPRLLLPTALFASGAALSAGLIFLYFDHADARDGDLLSPVELSAPKRRLSRSSSRRKSLVRRHSFVSDQQQLQSQSQAASSVPPTPTVPSYAGRKSADYAAAEMAAAAAAYAASQGLPIPPNLAAAAATASAPAYEQLALSIDNGGALDTAVAKLRDYVLRDFVRSWFVPSVAAPGPGRDVFPRSVATAFDTVIMKAALRLHARGASDLLVDGATRAASDIVAHLRMGHAAIDDPDDAAAAVAKYVSQSPRSDLARAIDPRHHAAAIRRVARRLLAGFLPAQDARNPLVYSILVEIMCTAVIWPVVTMLSAPHFVNGLLVTALEEPVPIAASARGGVAVYRKDLNVRVIQTRSHDDRLVAAVEDGGFVFFFTVLLRDKERRADAHAVGPEGSTPASLVFDHNCAFPIKSPVVDTETVILQLCRSSASGNQFALVAEAIVPLAELPHVGWVPLYDLGHTDGDDLKPVTELWLELEVADPEPEPTVVAPETSAAPAPLAASHEMLGSEISLASIPETRELAPAAGEFSEPSTVMPAPASPTVTNQSALPSPPTTPEHPSPAASMEAMALAVEEAVVSRLATGSEEEEVLVDFIPRDVTLVERGAPVRGRAMDDYDVDDSGLDFDPSEPPYESWTLDTVRASDTRSRAFAEYLRSLPQQPQQRLDHLLAFLDAASNYRLLTTLLDPADPSSRAAVQQEAYDCFDLYFACPHPVLPHDICASLEERIVLDPTPALFDPAVKLVADRLAPHVAAFAARVAAAERARMSVPRLLHAMPRDPRVRGDRPRAASVSAYDRVRRGGPDADPVEALAAKHAMLVEGVCAMDLAFVASSMNTMQMQMVVLDRLLNDAMEENAAADRVPHLAALASQIQCKLMALEPLLSGEAVTATMNQNRSSSSSSSSSLAVPSTSATVTRSPSNGGNKRLGGIASSAQSLKANVGMGAAKSVQGVRNVFKGLTNKESRGGWTSGSKMVTSKFKKKVSSMNLSAAAAASGAGMGSGSGVAAITAAGEKGGLMSPTFQQQQLLSRKGSAETLSNVIPNTSKFLASSSTALTASSQQLFAKVQTAPAAIASGVGSLAHGSLAVAQSTIQHSVALTSSLASTASSSISASASSIQSSLGSSSQQQQPATLASTTAITVATPPASSASIASTTAAEPAAAALSSDNADALIEASFAVLKHVFALDGTIRARIFGVVTQVLRPTLATHIQTRFGALVDTVSDPAFFARALEHGVIDNVWPNGQLQHDGDKKNGNGNASAGSDEEEMAATAARARELLEAALPDVVARILGKSNAAAGLRATFAMLQVEALNRALVVDLLESVAEVLVPDDELVAAVGFVEGPDTDDEEDACS